LEARSGKDDEVENFLQSALPMVREEPRTTAWFGVRFGRGYYGIFDVFPDDSARDAHLNGPVASALKSTADTLLSEAPKIQKVNILAHKFPMVRFQEPNTKGILLTFKAKSGHSGDVEKFLIDARAYVLEEERTTAWFAFDFGDGEYGIFDVFQDNGGRFAHLTGHVPRELGKHALSLLGGVPDVDLLNVVAEKLAPIAFF
jgi:quinol monooxygenase YgiN